MSVSVTLTLPDQPTTGRVRYSPLGGNGIKSPSKICDFNVVLAGDASGGTSTLTVQFDRTYAAVPAIMRCVKSVLTPDDFNFGIAPTGDGGFTYAIALNSVAGFNGGGASATWAPPPMYCEQEGPSGAAPFIVVVSTNVDAETTTFRGQLLLFELRARDFAPLEDIYSSLPRAGTTYTN